MLPATRFAAAQETSVSVTLWAIIVIAIGGVIIAACLYLTKRFKQPDIGVAIGAAVVLLGLCLLLWQFLRNKGVGSAGLLSGGLFIVVVLVISVFVASRRRANRHQG
jgi:drug/metabolite transporter (DMT)-like permease